MSRARAEDYLEAIGTIIDVKGYAQAKNVAEILGVSPSSVTEMFQKLSKEGYINYEKYGGATLTAKGKKIADSTRLKHQMLTDFFLHLGVDEKIADKDACKAEHMLSPETFDRLKKFMEFVHKKKDGPRWLAHFHYFYETGNYVECTPANQSNCPIHGNKRKNTKIQKS
jgi:DtxR family Mn-dependent transcriptional regulator